MISLSDKPKVISICGPTGVGKTSVGIDLAQHFDGEIISADSMQIYRYMDIGTAKPTAEELAQVAHHMIDIVDPDEDFDAVQFSDRARAVTVALHNQGKAALVVGGAGLYIKALLHGMFQSQAIEPGIRNRLKEEALRYGSHILHDRLQKFDPETASRLHPKDSYRIIRALETFEATGKTIAEYHRQHGFDEQPYQVLKIGLNIDRQVLYDRINRRVDGMINAGFVDEVKHLLTRGYGPDLKSMQSIGYRHMVDFIRGRLAWDECVRTLKQETRKYAKRQLTWFGADSEIIWKEPGQTREIKLLVEDFLNVGE